MNEENLNTIFSDSVQKSYHDPHINPEFYKSLNTRLMDQAQIKKAHFIKQAWAIRFSIAASAILIALVIFLIMSPQGQAFAESIRHLFTTTNIKEIPVENPDWIASPTFMPTFAVTLMPATETAMKENYIPPEISNMSSTDPACQDDPKGYTCQIAKAEKKVGYDLKELPYDPYTFKFLELHVLNEDEVSIYYERIGGGSYVYLTQAIGEMSSMKSSVPEDAIQDVIVGDNPGEYVIGNYWSDASTNSYKWGLFGTYRLRWTEGDRRFELRHDGCVDPRYEFCSESPDKLIKIAESLVYKPIPSSELRPDYLKSQAEASQISGFNVLAPTILPEGFVFDHGTYDPDLKQIRLSYVPASYEPGVAELLVVERPLLEIASNPGEDWSVDGELVDINGIQGFYQSNDEYNHNISWEANGLRITISIYASDLWYGGTLTKDQILEIARSMQ